MSLAEDIDQGSPRFESAEAFLAWVELQPERWELFDGVARRMDETAQMMAGGSRTHARISGNAFYALRGRLGVGPCEAFGSDLAVVLGPQRVVFPDISVTCEPEGDKALVSPVVVVEVLSPSTANYDRGDKASAYRRVPSLRHLVLIRQDRIWVSHYHRAAAGEDFTLTEIAQVDGRLDLTAVGAEVSLAELYARVTFAG